MMLPAMLPLPSAPVLRRLAQTAVAGLWLALALAGCDNKERAAAQAAAEAAARERAAEEMAQRFEEARAAQQWELARGHGEALLMDHPRSAAAARIEPLLDEVRTRAEAAREQRRLAAAWAYGAEPVGGGTQLSAAIYAQAPVDTDGSGARPVRLIFRDHPEWDRSSYLVLEAGDFDCYGGCRVPVRADGQPPRRMAASRPDTDEAIAMFIEDEAALWRLAKGAKTLAIEFPVKAGGTRTAVFEVGGLDPAKLPGW